MLSSKQNVMALISLEKYVLPIFNSNNEFIELKNRNDFIGYYKLCKILSLFNREAELSKLRDIILANFSQDQLGTFLQKLIESKNTELSKLNKSKSMLDLFIFRLKYLEGKVSSLENSWKMSGSVRGHPEVERFLQSDSPQMIYRGSGIPSREFQTRTTADNFVKNFSGVKSGYVTEMTVVKNPREKPYIIIKKPIQYMLSIRKANQAKFIKEIKCLKSYFI